MSLGYKTTPIFTHLGNYYNNFLLKTRKDIGIILAYAAGIQANVHIEVLHQLNLHFELLWEKIIFK